MAHLPKHQFTGIKIAKNTVLSLLLDEFLQTEYLAINKN